MNFELAIAVGLPATFFVAAFIVGCFEKRPVRVFAPADFQDPPRYLRAMVERAMEYGFAYRASGMHTKYTQNYVAVLLSSPDSRILVVIGDGKIAGLQSRSTILISRFTDGTFLFTADQVGAAELDSMTKRQIVMKGNFDELLTKHATKLETGLIPMMFPSNADWSTLEEVYRLRIDRIVKSGLARYVDDQKQIYCYSVWGSFRASILHGFGQLLRPGNYLRQHKQQPG